MTAAADVHPLHARRRGAARPTLGAVARMGQALDTADRYVRALYDDPREARQELNGGLSHHDFAAETLALARSAEHGDPETVLRERAEQHVFSAPAPRTVLAAIALGIYTAPPVELTGRPSDIDTLTVLIDRLGQHQRRAANYLHEMLVSPPDSAELAVAQRLSRAIRRRFPNSYEWRDLSPDARQRHLLTARVVLGAVCDAGLRYDDEHAVEIACRAYTDHRHPDRAPTDDARRACLSVARTILTTATLHEHGRRGRSGA